MTLLHWFRRDLRVADNTALAHAARDADRVVPVFILDDHYAADPDVGPARFRFLRESLEELARALPHSGGRLIVRPGPAARALPALLAETDAEGVYANAEIGPYPERRDREAAAAVEAAGGKFRLFEDELLVAPDRIATDAGDPYTVYTPFSKKWMAAEKRDPWPAPAALATPALDGVPLSKVAAWRAIPPDPFSPPGGEVAAQALLARFFASAAGRYADDRDRPDRPGTSRLSPHLHFGTISARTIRAAAERAWQTAAPREREQVRKFILELAWREFYHHVLFHFPRVASGSFRPEFDRLAWKDNPQGLEAWKRGRTGFPLVDAAMRELATTHWMHNRARMVAASFLTKDLHVHWREGEALVRARARRRRSRQQQRRMAVGGGLRDRRRALLSRLQPGAPVAQVRPRGCLHPPIRSGALRRVRRQDPRAMDHERRGTEGVRLPDRKRLPRPHPGPRHGRRRSRWSSSPESASSPLQRPKKGGPDLFCVGAGKEGIACWP